MTNADKVRSMPNKELAELIRYRSNCEFCSFEFGDDSCRLNFCTTGIERWLESECYEND